MLLRKIVADTADALKRRRQALPAGRIIGQIKDLPAPRSFLAALNRVKRPALIAELKRASPSRGLLCREFDPVNLARVYEANGAGAVSVLTEERYFGGTPDYLQAVRAAVNLPLLRKDFIIDEYQLLEARLWGSDAVLLIAALLDRHRLSHLLQVAGDLGLECLVEVHTREELALVLEAPVSLVGINNRNLTTFTTDLYTTRELSRHLPPGLPFVAESGIHTARDVEQVARWGATAVLVGEALVTAPDVGRKVRELAGVKTDADLG